MKYFTGKTNWMGLAGFATLAAIVGFTLVHGVFTFSSVCSRCGGVRRTTEWQIPHTEITLFTYSSEATTPLSQVLMTNNIVPTHNHNWLFAHGGGNGVRCALGDGQGLQSAVNSEDFARMIQALHNHGLLELRTRLLRGVFDPETTFHFRCVGMKINESGITTAELQSKVTEELQLIDELVQFSRQVHPN